MTEQEKTELRIKAAKAVGLTVYPADWPHWGEPGYLTYSEMLASLPNPLESAEDCEALLSVILNKRCSVLPGIRITEGDFMAAWRFAIDGHHTGVYISLRSHRCGIEIEKWSENPDRRAAYREAITLACVAAWEAEQPCD